MTPRQMLDYLLDHDILELDIQPDDDDYDGIYDIDLSKGVDANGYTVDGCIEATLVRRYQAGELANYVATLLPTDAANDLVDDVGIEPIGQGYTGAVSSYGWPDDDVLEQMADDNADALATLVAAHKRVTA